jgi:hypothetical protein
MAMVRAISSVKLYGLTSKGFNVKGSSLLPQNVDFSVKVEQHLALMKL